MYQQKKEWSRIRLGLKPNRRIKNEPDLSLYFLGSTNIAKCGTNSKKIISWAHWEIQARQRQFYRCYKILYKCSLNHMGYAYGPNIVRLAP